MKDLGWVPIQAIARNRRLLARWLLLGALTLGLWFLAAPALTRSAPGVNAAQMTEAVPTCKIGVYLMSLHNFDFVRKSFGADFWLWSVCPTKTLQPLNAVEFINAEAVKTTLNSTVQEQSKALSQEQQVYWSALKVAGTFRHDWKVHNFPFDRHTLQIILEEGNANTEQFVYSADYAQSTYGRDIHLDGWHISNFAIAESQRHYATTFGNPRLHQMEGSNYSRLVISIGLTRDRLLSFFKLNTGVYIAVALAMLSFFLSTAPTGLLSARLGMLVGSVFATLIDLRVAEGTLGRTDDLTLVDQIHICGLSFIFGAAVVTIFSHYSAQAGRVKAAARHDRLCFIGFVVTFILVNLLLIGLAIIRG